MEFTFNEYKKYCEFLGLKPQLYTSLKEFKGWVEVEKRYGKEFENEK